MRQTTLLDEETTLRLAYAMSLVNRDWKTSSLSDTWTWRNYLESFGHVTQVPSRIGRGIHAETPILSKMSRIIRVEDVQEYSAGRCYQWQKKSWADMMILPCQRDLQDGPLISRHIMSLTRPSLSTNSNRSWITFVISSLFSLLCPHDIDLENQIKKLFST